MVDALHPSIRAVASHEASLLTARGARGTAALHIERENVSPPADVLYAGEEPLGAGTRMETCAAPSVYHAHPPQQQLQEATSELP